MGLPNPYPGGECTWYAYSRTSSWLPVLYGDAGQWIHLAQAKGLSTGNTPRVGALAVWGPGQAMGPNWNALGTGHVGYVSAVNADGTITVDDMNDPSLGVVKTHTNFYGGIGAPGGYIYPPGSVDVPSGVTASTVPGGTYAPGSSSNTVASSVNPGDWVATIVTFLTKAGEVLAGLLLAGAGLYVLLKSKDGGFGAAGQTAAGALKGTVTKAAKVVAL